MKRAAFYHMVRHAFTLLSITVLAVTVATVFSVIRSSNQTIPIAVAASDYEVPGGFIWVDWGLRSPTGYNSMQVNITIEKVGQNDALTYVGSPFGFVGGGNGGYGGLQTHVSTLGGAKGVIFSIWNVTGGQEQPGGVKTVDTVSCDGFVGAVCIQIALPYSWQVGQEYSWGYRYIGDRPGFVNESALEAYVIDVSTGIETKVGSIFVPKTYGNIYGLNTFLEVFPPYGTSGPGANDCNKRVEVVLKATKAQANGGSVLSTSWWQADSTKPPACTSTYGYENLSDGYRMRHNSAIPAVVPPSMPPTTAPTTTPPAVNPTNQENPTVVPPTTQQTTQTENTTGQVSSTPIQPAKPTVLEPSVVDNPSNGIPENSKTEQVTAATPSLPNESDQRKKVILTGSSGYIAVQVLILGVVGAELKRHAHKQLAHLYKHGV